jgi:hypothetical protein
MIALIVATATGPVEVRIFSPFKSAAFFTGALLVD